MLTQAEQRKAAKEFAKRWEGVGYEKGDSATFWLELLNEVYGIDRPGDFIRFEDRVKMDHTSYIDGHIPTTHVLIEQKSMDKDLTKAIRQSDGTLLSPFQQAKRYSAELPYSERPRWIVTCNFKEFHIYDMEKPSGEPQVILLSELENDYYRMFFLVDETDENIQKEIEVSLKAGELVGVLYDALLKEYQNPEDEKTLRDLNVLCVRLVFCFYAEDAGLFGKHSLFHDYLMKYKDFNFRDALIKLFRVLDQKPEERDPYLEDDLAAFPYVNGELFADQDIVIPRVNDKIIDIILNQASANFDWSHISPTIFGGVFESTLNPETRRSGGMHYTSIKNIHKVIDPLFMNELNEEFEEIKDIKVVRTRNSRLDKFQEKLASLKFLDPAAGSGNFLTETYLSLRKLENKVIKLKLEISTSTDKFNPITFGEVFNPIKVSIGQFYGIEINDFAVTVARTALWIAESQMFKETQDIIHTNIDFLPLESYSNIAEGNALRMDWEKVVPSAELSYIMGNPPFVGKKEQTTEQKNDMKSIFGKVRGVGNLDYVTGWYKKAAEYIQGKDIMVAFVSTNSITQGEQVPIFWEEMFKMNIIVYFAYKSFVWNSEAQNMAHVHCVIIGFSCTILKREKRLFTNNSQFNIASNINPYLVDAPTVIVEGRATSISEAPRMNYGSMPIDKGNLILNEEEVNIVLNELKGPVKYVREYVGGQELINNTKRWCLWLKGADPKELRKSKFIMNRINANYEFRRSSSRKQTNELAKTPTLFGEIRQPDTNMIVVPKVSSEKRKYIPISFVEPNIIVNGSALIIPDGNLYHLGILTSNVHMSWMATVGGRLEMRYQYSGSLVYNTFPWPNSTQEQKLKIETTAQAILVARALYPDSTLADLYDELVMPPELRIAHQENDKVVMEAYGFDWRTMSESECVAELMKIYEQLSK